MVKLAELEGHTSRVLSLVMSMVTVLTLWSPRATRAGYSNLAIQAMLMQQKHGGDGVSA